MPVYVTEHERKSIGLCFNCSDYAVVCIGAKRKGMGRPGNVNYCRKCWRRVLQAAKRLSVSAGV